MAKATSPNNHHFSSELSCGPRTAWGPRRNVCAPHNKPAIIIEKMVGKAHSTQRLPQLLIWPSAEICQTIRVGARPNKMAVISHKPSAKLP